MGRYHTTNLARGRRLDIGMGILAAAALFARTSGSTVQSPGSRRFEFSARLPCLLPCLPITLLANYLACHYLACQGFWTPILFEILPVRPNIVPSVQSQCHILKVVAGDEPGVDFFPWMIFLSLRLLSALISNLLIPGDEHERPAQSYVLRLTGIV